MKVAIEARALSVSAGIKTYVHQLITHLLSDTPANEYVVAYDNARHMGSYPNAQEITVPLRHEFLISYWLQHPLSKALRAQHPAVVHYTKAAVPRKLIAPTVVTIYDVIPILFPQGQSVTRRWYWPHALAQAANTSDHIITISEASKRDIMRTLGVPADKITVTPLACDHSLFRLQNTNLNVGLEKYRVPEPYIVSVGTLEPRKNIPSLLRSFASISTRIPHHVVLIGKRAGDAANIQAEISRLQITDRVHVLENVPTHDLPLLLANASLFAMTSIYEGWGLPALEALACGVPVVTSDGGSLPQVVGSAASIVPFTATSLADRLHDTPFEQRFAHEMATIVQSPTRIETMRQQGLRQAQKFTWQEVARTTAEVYRHVA